MAFSTADPNAFVGISLKQTAQGTPNVSAAGYRFVKYLAGMQFQPMTDNQWVREGGGGLDWSVGYTKTTKVDGQVVCYLRPEIAGQLFALMPGGATWSGGTVPATHQFHTGHASFPWFTMQVGHPGTSMLTQITDARFTGLSIEGNSGEPLKVTMPFTGINFGASGAIVAPTYGTPTGQDAFFLYYQSPTIILAGAQDTTISNWKIDFNLGVEELQAQSINLDDIAIMNRDAALTVTRRYNNPALWNQIYYGGSANIAPTAPIATSSFDAMFSYDSGNNARAIRVYAPLVAFDEDTITDLDPDGKTVYETITGKILKGGTAAVNILVNSQHASAY